MSDPNHMVVGYITANESELINLSLQQMLSYSWVAKIVVLNTDSKNCATTDPRVAAYSEDFGYGFDKSVADGGFDEVSARNRLIDLMRKHAREEECEWLLLCDSDEFFSGKTGALPIKLNRAGKDIAWLNCWHLTGHNSYLHEDRYDVLVSGHRMYDPHPRLFRRNVLMNYAKNQDLFVHYPDAANDTLHCWPQFEADRSLGVPGVYHLHMRYLLGKSDYKAMLSDSCRVKELGQSIRLSPLYLAAMRQAASPA